MNMTNKKLNRDRLDSQFNEPLILRSKLRNGSLFIPRFRDIPEKQKSAYPIQPSLLVRRMTTWLEARLNSWVAFELKKVMKPIITFTWEKNLCNSIASIKGESSRYFADYRKFKLERNQKLKAYMLLSQRLKGEIQRAFGFKKPGYFVSETEAVEAQYFRN
ncbi:hypothetical protein COLO4_03967 [Corchorus olitorius]|uniref:Uncharacterized protein n=1 Tax=Corchorus olitorius TaxID=93759 RepID=A0A1R3KVY4_9ROSI|nr:hypothetical protein COLO4_03967 [Corchorus olitorius]